MSLRRHPDVRLLSSEQLASGRVFDVWRESLELPSGLRQDVLVIDHPGAVAIVAEDARGRIAAVRQYRHAIGEWLLEIPAGRVDRGEPRLEAARRELEEETGLCAAQWTRLGCFFPAPGFCSEEIELFWARELSPAGAGRRPPDADEELTVSWWSFQEAQREMARDAKSAVALGRLRELRSSAS